MSYQRPFSEFGKRHYDEGFIEGYVEGLRESYREGLKQALVGSECEKILLILELRGIPVDEGQRERVMRSTDLVQLELWSRAARIVETAEDLFR